MAAFIAEVIFEVVINIILVFPGAAIRWLFLRRKKTFKELLNDRYEINALLGGVCIALLAVPVFLIKHYLILI